LNSIIAACLQNKIREDFFSCDALLNNISTTLAKD
jgi:hypothetical protein